MTPFSTQITSGSHTVLITADNVEDLDYGVRAVKAHEALVKSLERYRGKFGDCGDTASQADAALKLARGEA